MSESMDRAGIRAWTARWKLVADREVEELRALSIGDRLSQLATLFELRSRLGDDPFDQEEIERTRERWNLLRRRSLEQR